MNSDLRKELRNFTGNCKQKVSNTNFTSILATTAPRISWRTSVRR